MVEHFAAQHSFADLCHDRVGQASSDEPTPSQSSTSARKSSSTSPYRSPETIPASSPMRRAASASACRCPDLGAFVFAGREVRAAVSRDGQASDAWHSRSRHQRVAAGGRGDRCGGTFDDVWRVSEQRGHRRDRRPHRDDHLAPTRDSCPSASTATVCRGPCPGQFFEPHSPRPQ